MHLLILSFIAGVLSVLAPCVLPVLPIILGSSLGAQKRYRPLIIVLSTGFFITFFTVVLKASSVLIGVSQEFWLTFSAVIIIVYGLTLIWPELREKFSMAVGLTNANTLATKAKSHSGVRGDILLGAALGPIFASCSPTYAILLSLVFPKSFALGIGYTLVYSLGFSLLLLIIAYGGRAVVQKLNRAANPRGRFKKTLGVLLILTGVLIATGLMKKLEVKLLASESFDLTRIEQRLIARAGIGKKQDNKACFTSSSGVYTCDSSAVQNSGTRTSVSNDPREKLLNVNYAAPELEGVQNWLNTEGYKSINDLKGKVVIIDFRTYSCVNCIRTLPYLRQLHETYADSGLVIIGVHAPEFQFEHDIRNVQKAVTEFGLKYPIVQDNNFTTRRNYDNLYRPAKYIIDREGNVRYTHFGEGKYQETEEVVQYLLGLNGSGVLQDTKAGRNIQQTPETYLGSARREHYTNKANDTLHARWLEGAWSTQSESVTLTKGTGSISINASAKEVNLVLGTDNKQINATVFVDGKEYKKLIINAYQLYNLMKMDVSGTHRVEIRFDEPGVVAYAYTFG